MPNRWNFQKKHERMHKYKSDLYHIFLHSFILYRKTQYEKKLGIVLTLMIALLLAACKRNSGNDSKIMVMQKGQQSN